MQIREDVSDKKLAELEEQILKDGLLKIANTPKKTFAVRKKLKLAVADVLEKLTRNYWDRRDGHNENTIYVKYGRKQCSGYNFRRSQGDLFRVIKYYYPNTTFKEFRAALFELINECKAQCHTVIPLIKEYSVVQDLRESQEDILSIYSPEIKDELGLTLKVEMV